MLSNVNIESFHDMLMLKSNSYYIMSTLYYYNSFNNAKYCMHIHGAFLIVHAPNAVHGRNASPRRCLGLSERNIRLNLEAVHSILFHGAARLNSSLRVQRQLKETNAI